jgi:uncharacterized membrane protein
MFNKVALIEYPRKGVWSLVFVASEKEDRDQRSARRQGTAIRTVAVFMPSTPNPTTGFLMYVPTRRRHRARHERRGRGQAGHFGRSRRARPGRRR